MAARLTLGLLDKPYADIAPEADLKRVRDYLDDRPLGLTTRATYRKGLNKLADYLRHRLQLPNPETAPQIPAELPPAIAGPLRQYLAYRRRTQPTEQKTESTTTLARHLIGLLRRLALNDLAELTPARWFDYVDRRLQAGIAPSTLNRERHNLRHLLQFLQRRDIQISEDFLLVEPLGTPDALPRDVSVPQTRRLLAEIGEEIEANNPVRREAGLLDQAWMVLMLHSGLRTGEIRRLRLGQLNLAGRCLRVEGSKGNADRVVYLSREGLEALDVYLSVRVATGDDHVFTRHRRPLPVGYCGRRLRLYGNRCGVRITPHQLRHTAATVLLNAGASILIVQRLLGHERVDTTLRYTRLYDSTVAGDYHRAIEKVEGKRDSKTIICTSPLNQVSLMCRVRFIPSKHLIYGRFRC